MAKPLATFPSPPPWSNVDTTPSTAAGQHLSCLKIDIKLIIKSFPGAPRPMIDARNMTESALCMSPGHPTCAECSDPGDRVLRLRTTQLQLSLGLGHLHFAWQSSPRPSGAETSIPKRVQKPSLQRARAGGCHHWQRPLTHGFELHCAS
jgi:hypothetical protein